MISTSDKAVSDYVNSLLLDVSYATTELPIEESIPDAILQSQDSISVGQRIEMAQDAFAFMQLNESLPPHQLWLAIHSLIQLVQDLPDGAVKAYALRQCQTLMNNLQNQEG